MTKSWIFTILIIILTLGMLILYFFDVLRIDELSAFGSLIAAAGSIIAIIWFYKSLHQQSVQLNEQRQQFQQEFNNLRLESKRSTINLAKTLLDSMENEINKSLEGLGKLENLSTLFLTKFFPLFKPISESDNYEVVMTSIEEANRILKPSRTFLSTLKLVSSLFLDNDGITPIDDDGKPEWFIITYKEKIENIPLLSKYLPIAIMLSEYMARIKLDIVSIAGGVSLAMLQPELVDKRAILKSVLECEAKLKILPQIARVWLTTLPEDFINEVKAEQ